MDAAHNQRSEISCIPTNAARFAKVMAMTITFMALVIIGALAISGVIPSIGVYGGIGFEIAAIFVFVGQIIYLFRTQTSTETSIETFTGDQADQLYPNLNDDQFFICNLTSSFAGKAIKVIYTNRGWHQYDNLSGLRSEGYKEVSTQSLRKII